MSIDRISRQVDDHADRIGAIEQGIAEMRTDIKYITKAVGTMQSQLGWVVKSVLGSIFLAIVAYLVQGGFAL